MKNLLVLLFYLTGPIGAFHNFFENVPPHQWFFKMRRLEPRRLTVIPRPSPRLDLSKFIYWKQLLELECFKELCSKNQLKDRSVHKRPPEMIGQRQMPAFRSDGTDHYDQVSNFYRMRENKVEPVPKRKYSAHERVILWPPERNFTAKEPNVSPTRKEFTRNKTLQMESESGVPKWGPKESIVPKDFMLQKTDYRLPYDFPSSTTKNREGFEDYEAFHEGVFPKEQESPRRTRPGDALPELFLKPGVLRSSTVKYSEDISHGFKHRVRPDRIKPYEVEEIIEEKFLVGVDEDENYKDEDRGKDIPGKDIRKNIIPDSEVKKKADHFQNVIDNSVQTILKGLINPATETMPSPVPGSALPLENSGKQSIVTTVKSSTTTSAFKTFTSHPLYESIYNRPLDKQTFPRPGKIQPSDRYNGWRQQIPEATQKSPKKLLKPDARADSSRKFDLNPSFQEQYFRSLLLTDKTKRPTATEAYEQSSTKIFNADKFRSNLDKNLEEKPMRDRKITELSSADTLTSLDLLRNLMADHMSNFAPTEEVTSTTQKTPPTTTVIPESSKELSPTTVDSRDISSESNEAFTTQDFMQTVKHFPEVTVDDVAETEHNFLEFSDRPMSFDLLKTTIELDPTEDQDAIWKNSRRMHFGHEARRATIFTRTSAAPQTEQRRSDILITDNLADYVDDDNNLSTLSYFEKLKLNNSLFAISDPYNLTSDDLIPLIPVVINDLREGRIPSKDISIISHALGKYWNPIVELANFTNLDMLPLIKMKDEKDLENVLQNFLPEVKTSTAVTGTTKNDYKFHEDYLQSYDYMDEYKDLYKDILGQDLSGKKKRFRSRRDAEDDLKTLEATREYFDSLREEQRDDGSEYIFEDIIYDEVSDVEDESVFELMEVSDVHVGKET